MTLFRTDDQIWVDMDEFIVYPWCDGDVLIMPVVVLNMGPYGYLRCIPSDARNIYLTSMNSLCLSKNDVFKINTQLCKEIVGILRWSRGIGIVNLTTGQKYTLATMQNAINMMVY